MEVKTVKRLLFDEKHVYENELYLAHANISFISITSICSIPKFKFGM
jgi:hypothetical protein